MMKQQKLVVMAKSYLRLYSYITCCEINVLHDYLLTKGYWKHNESNSAYEGCSIKHNLIFFKGD